MFKKTTPTFNAPKFSDIPAYVRKQLYPYGWKSTMDTVTDENK